MAIATETTPLIVPSAGYLFLGGTSTTRKNLKKTSHRLAAPLTESNGDGLFNVHDDDQCSVVKWVYREGRAMILKLAEK